MNEINAETPPETGRLSGRLKCEIEITFELDKGANKMKDLMYLMKKAIEAAASELPETAEFTLQSAHIRRTGRTMRRVVRRNPRRNTPESTIQ